MSNDSLAWEELYKLYHNQILASAKFCLRTNTHESSEEVAAIVWFTLLNEDFRLIRRFNPTLGDFGQYLFGITRNICRNYRKNRLDPVLNSVEMDMVESEDVSKTPLESVLSDEFKQHLTPRELEFFEFCTSNSDASFSNANERKLRSRVRKKLLDYLD